MAFIDKIFQSIRFYKNTTLLPDRPNLRVVTGRDIVAKNDSYSSIDVDLTDIEDQADQLESDLAVLDAAIDALDLSGIEASITALESDVAAVESSIATHTADIATNTAGIATNATDIGTADTNNSTNTTNVATNTADIATNTADIATNTASIGANFTAIETNTTNITANASDIADLQAGTSPVGAPLMQWLHPLPYSGTSENSYDIGSGWGPSESTTATTYAPTIGSADLPHWGFGSAGAGLSVPVEVPIGATSVTVTIYACTDSTDDNGIDLQLDGRDLHDNLSGTPASHTITTPNTTLGSDTSAPTAEVIATSKALSELALVAGELGYLLLTRESTSNADALQVVAIKLQFA